MSDVMPRCLRSLLVAETSVGSRLHRPLDLSARARYLLSALLGVAVIALGGCFSLFSAGDSYIDRLNNRGVVALSIDNPYLTANLLVADLVNSSEEVRGFIEKRGVPNAIKVSRPIFSNAEVYLFYLQKRERYSLERTKAGWVIDGPMLIDSEDLGELKQVVRNAAGKPTLLSAAELDKLGGRSTPLPTPTAEPASQQEEQVVGESSTNKSGASFDGSFQSPLLALEAGDTANGEGAESKPGSSLATKAAVPTKSQKKDVLTQEKPKKPELAPSVAKKQPPEQGSARKDEAAAPPANPIETAVVSEVEVQASSTTASTSGTQERARPEQLSSLAELRAIDGIIKGSSAPNAPLMANGDLVHKVLSANQRLVDLARWYTLDRGNTGRIARVNQLSTDQVLATGSSVTIPAYLVKNKKVLRSEDLAALATLGQ